MKKYPKDTNYLVTEDGKVYSKISNKFLTSTTREDGYLVIGIGECVKRLHRLVAETYIQNPQKLPEVNHKDGIKANCHKDNLEWVTSKENKEHAWDMGLYKDIREDHHHAVFSDEQIHKVCKLLQDGCRNKDVAAIMGMHKDQIAHIKRGDIWRTISEQYNLKVNRNNRKSVETIVKVCGLLEQGKTNQEVSSIVKGIDHKEVNRIRTGEIHTKISSCFNIPKSRFRKTTEEEVRLVCELLIKKKHKNKEIAVLVGVSVSAVSSIKNRKVWEHITCDYNW